MASSSSGRARFTLTLCLASVRTKDGHSFCVRTDDEDGGTVVSVGQQTVTVDEVIQRALPSRVAGAVLSAVEASPPHSHSAHILVGASLAAGATAGSSEASRGSAVVESLLHSQHVSNRDGATLFFEECLVFGKESPQDSFSRDASAAPRDDGAIRCETVSSTDTWEFIQQDILGHLRDISLVLFKYPSNRSAAVVLARRLTTSHIAALALAPRRGVYLCVDEHTTARDVVAGVDEMRALRDSLGTPTAAEPCVPFLRYHAVPGTPGATETSVSNILDALARSDEEYSALTTAVEQDLKAHLRQAQDDRARLEQQLTEEKLSHRLEVNELRRQLRRSPSRAPSAAVPPAATIAGPALVGYRVDAAPPPVEGDGAVLQELREALKDAQRGRQFAEEKLRLLEFKHGLEGNRGRSQTGRGAVSVARSVSPRQSRPGGGGGGGGDATMMSGLESENLTLAQELQERELQLQLQLREAMAELAVAQAAKREMESTLLLQSRTIAEAKRALAARGQGQGVVPPSTPPRSSGGMISPTRGPAGPIPSPLR